MNLTEQYPLDVTKAGDSVKSAILKNRSEILGVMDNLNAQPSGSVGYARNRILSAHMVNNVYNFLSSDGLTVAIDGSIEPVLLTFSDGYNDNGAVDYIGKITKLVSAWSVPANNTSYLYIERNESGGLTYGSCTTPLVVSNAMPSVTRDDNNVNWYNPDTATMLVWNGTEWNKKLRVFVGSVKTEGTTVTDTTYQEVSSSISVDERHKLEGIEAESTKNDYCYKGVSVGDTEVVASGKQDVLTLKTAGDIKATADSSNRTITLTVEIMGQIYQQALKDAKLQAHPVGSIYESTESTSPEVLFGGTWEPMDAGRVLVSSGTASTGTVYSSGAKGGEEATGLSIDNLPPHSFSGTTSYNGEHNHSFSGAQNSDGDTNTTRFESTDDFTRTRAWLKTNHTNVAGNHNHTFTTNTLGSGVKHNNMQPYEVIHRWKRTA